MSRVLLLPDPDHLPALDRSYAMARPALGIGEDQPPPRIFLLYGSLRERSFSRLAVEEAARLLRISLSKAAIHPGARQWRQVAQAGRQIRAEKAGNPADGFPGGYRGRSDFMLVRRELSLSGGKGMKT